MPVVFTDHAKYPNIADVTGDFVYARLQRGKDTVPTAYPPKDIAAWAGRLQSCKATPRDVYAYVIHEGKVRAPAAAMALSGWQVTLIERLGHKPTLSRSAWPPGTGDPRNNSRLEFFGTVFGPASVVIPFAGLGKLLRRDVVGMLAGRVTGRISCVPASFI